MTSYRHTKDMGEISGFGNGYEECCQDMLEAGVKHIIAQKFGTDEISISGFEGIYGLVFPNNAPTKELERVVVEAAKGEATGAMVHTIMERLSYIARKGWSSYCNELRKLDHVENES